MPKTWSLHDSTGLETDHGLTLTFSMMVGFLPIPGPTTMQWSLGSQSFTSFTAVFLSLNVDIWQTEILMSVFTAKILLAIGGLRARTTPWFFSHFWKCSEVVDNYFWRLSKMAEKSRGHSCSEPFNSPYCLLYNSCGVSLKNLAVGSTNDSPLVISILTTCLPNNF